MTMFCITRKLDIIQKEVREWSKSSFESLSKEKKATKKKLEALQNQLAQSDTLIEQQQEERECRFKWKTHLSKENVFYKKTYRVQ